MIAPSKSRADSKIRRQNTKWRALRGNPKTAINAYLCELARGRRVFTLEDPEKWRTTEMLNKVGAEVIALSSNPKIKDRGHVCAFSTAYLAQVDPSRRKPYVCWLDYCGSCRRSHKHFDWVLDLQYCLDWATKNGDNYADAHETRGGEFHLVRAAADRPARPLRAVRGYVRVYGRERRRYVRVHGGAGYIPGASAERVHPPLPGKRVRVQDHTGTWEGVVRKQYTPNEFEVHTDEGCCTVLRSELSHVEE